jgi:hypothetical protein
MPLTPNTHSYNKRWARLPWTGKDDLAAEIEARCDGGFLFEYLDDANPEGPLEASTSTKRTKQTKIGKSPMDRGQNHSWSKLTWIDFKPSSASGDQPTTGLAVTDPDDDKNKAAHTVSGPEETSMDPARDKEAKETLEVQNINQQQPDGNERQLTRASSCLSKKPD